MFKKEIAIGLVLGIITCALFSSIIFLSNNPGLPGDEYMKIYLKGKLIVPVISLSLLGNFALFFIFLKFDKDEISKGLLLATILIGIVVLALKFF